MSEPEQAEQGDHRRYLGTLTLPYENLRTIHAGGSEVRKYRNELTDQLLVGKRVGTIGLESTFVVREATLLQQIRHDNLVPVFDVVRVTGLEIPPPMQVLEIIMPFYERGSVCDAFSRDVRFTLVEAVTLVDFATSALTMDLLEAELVDALAELPGHAVATTRGQRLPLPHRDAHLPSVAHALDFEDRICAGGPVVLLAAARPGSRGGRRPADYALLVQERSPRVLNVVGRLAVIPKAFPTCSASHCAGCSTTRTPSAYRLECLGFGVNLLTGNYEFPCLLVINDDEWWARFGGQIEANWEIRQVRLYSSRDAAGLQHLLLDPRWSNEGLFAFIEGLRRLAELEAASRVTIPEIDMGA